MKITIFILDFKHYEFAIKNLNLNTRYIFKVPHCNSQNLNTTRLQRYGSFRVRIPYLNVASDVSSLWKMQTGIMMVTCQHKSDLNSGTNIH